jgi:thioredoxin-like negative regulator of GroEL
MEVYEEYSGDVLFYKLDISKYAEVAQRYRVTSTPTLIYFKAGEEVERQDAFPSKEEIIKVIEEIRR